MKKRVTGSSTDSGHALSEAELGSEEKVTVMRNWWQQMYGVINAEKDNEVSQQR